jgi:uncharacterized protein with PhoU and TrkA domain
MHVFKSATEILKITTLNEPSSLHEMTISCLICVGKMGIQLIALRKGFVEKISDENNNKLNTCLSVMFSSCSPLYAYGFKSATEMRK